MPAYDPDVFPGGVCDITLDGTNAYATKADFNEDAGMKDATTTGDYNAVQRATWSRMLATTKVVNFNITGFVDMNNMILPNIRAGTEIENVIIPLGDGSKNITIALAIVKSCKFDTGGVDGLQTFQITGQSQGNSVTWPT